MFSYSWKFSCLSLLSVGIVDVSHHAQPKKTFLVFNIKIMKKLLKIEAVYSDMKWRFVQ